MNNEVTVKIYQLLTEVYRVMGQPRFFIRLNWIHFIIDLFFNATGSWVNLSAQTKFEDYIGDEYSKLVPF